MKLLLLLLKRRHQLLKRRHQLEHAQQRRHRTP